MDPKTKSKVALALLLLVSMFLTIYAANAYYVASFAYEKYGHLWWPNTLGGSFYPWPYLPTGLAGQMLTPLDQGDAQYYLYIIKSGVLIYLTVVLWVTFFWQAWKTRRLGIRSENKRPSLRP